MRREAFKFRDLVRLISETLRYIYIFKYATMPSLVEVMACCPFGAMPLVTCTNDGNLSIEYNNFHQIIWIWKCHLQNVTHFVPGSMCQCTVKWDEISLTIWWLCHQRQVSRAWISNCIMEYYGIQLDIHVLDTRALSRYKDCLSQVWEFPC